MAELRELVSAAKAGDKDAFSSLYQGIYKDLYRLALYCLKNPADAEDVVSETVADAWQGLPKLREPDAFRPWILKILSAKCKRKLREYIRSRQEEEVTEEIAFSGGFEDGETIELQRAFSRLSGEERMILSLVVVSGYDSGEAARILGMNRNTLRSKQSRALSKLREMLGSEN